MALIDKDIVITPNKGSSAADPNIVFTSDANSSITVTLTSSNGGTLSFAGSIGALLNLVNTSVGTLFAVNDGSGIPSLEVVDDGTVRIAQFGGNVGVGTGSPAYKLDVVGTVRSTALTSATINAGALTVAATITAATITAPTGTVSSATVNAQTLGVGTVASGVAGEIRATNNITAYYSDDGLKTRFNNIENALDLVDQLSGFYYQANQTAADLGYEVKREIGVSAQEVQKVLPEIVAPAPISDKYLTVRYEKFAPLLIEAIKELRREINNIKQELDTKK